jgi:hypothetical protein
MKNNPQDEAENPEVRYQPPRARHRGIAVHGLRIERD